MILGIFAIFVYANKAKFLDHSHTKFGGGGDLKGGIKTALDRYEVDIGTYPKSFQDLLQPPTDITNWNGPYLDQFPIDYWGNKYIYEFPGKHNLGSYDLMSSGPDGKPGTKDDIGNW